MSLDISRWWLWRGIFFYDSFVATKEVEWTVGGHVSMRAVPDRTGHKSSCLQRVSRESCLAWCQHKTDLSFSWDGENDGLGTHLLLFPRVLFLLRFGVMGCRKVGFEVLRAFSGVKGASCFGVALFSFFLCVYTWACILYHDVASDNPLGCCRHGQVGHVCSWGWGLMGFFFGEFAFHGRGKGA